VQCLHMRLPMDGARRMKAGGARRSPLSDVALAQRMETKSPACAGLFG